MRLGKWLAIGAVAMVIIIGGFDLLMTPAKGTRTTQDSISYDQLLAEIDAGQVEAITVRSHGANFSLKGGVSGSVTFPPSNVPPGLSERLLNKKVRTWSIADIDDVPTFVSVLINWTPLLVIIGALWAIGWFGVRKPIRQLCALLESQARTQRSTRDE